MFVRLALALSLFPVSGWVVASAPAAEVRPARPSVAPASAARPLLTLKGAAGVAGLSMAQIEALGMREVRTGTFWPEDDGSYAGPLLADVLKQAGLERVEAIRVRARDGFSQRIPRQDWERWPVILATRRDGQPMTPRQKGPLRIIYPRDLAPELSDSVYRLRWVWLIDAIEAEPGK
ncbi:MAG: molybdopterin-dependent oxidoreductase [Dechloromonas sp.]|nr:MAG: molybdopterin-dependent oxidoreductase [Dechloromonas sp.]